MKAEGRLETLERWMQAVVMHPEGAEAGLRSQPARRLVPAAVRARIGRNSDSADRVGRRLGRWFEEWAGAHLFVKGDRHL